MCDEFDVEIGYLDYILGVEVCLLVVVMGVMIIEKYFMFDKVYFDFCDYVIVVDFDEFVELVWRIREVEMLLGCDVKEV